MLKEIRRQIAMANDIAFVTEECKHKGDCAGTCPKCESEVRYLEQQLASRRRLGLTTRVVGLSLGIAALAPAVVTSCVKDGDMDIEQLQGDVNTEPTMGIVGPAGPCGDNGQGQGGDGQGSGTEGQAQ